jgi:hypothetical protein
MTPEEKTDWTKRYCIALDKARQVYRYNTCVTEIHLHSSNEEIILDIVFGGDDFLRRKSGIQIVADDTMTIEQIAFVFADYYPRN